MTRAVVIVAAIAASAVARADEPVSSPAPAPAPAPANDSADTADAHIAKARDLHDKGDFDGARAEILVAYKLAPRPELLFALGQLEFNLHHYQAAIDYYERFEATQPNGEQGALAEQAIGAARAELSRPLPAAPKPPAPPPHREWDGIDTALAAFGGLAIAAGGGLLFEAVHLSNNTSGTLADYDQRLDTARHVRLAAGISAGAGVAAIGVGLLRWRFHFVETVEVQASPTSAAVTLERVF